MEHPYCRYICVLIFVMSLTSEFNLIVQGFWLMIAIPSKNESWVRYERPTWADKDHVKNVHGWTELDLVKIKIAGMSLQWKIINVLVVLVPKVFLWFSILGAGTVLLMNTACIDDIIINSTALGFVLCMDELVFATFGTSQARTILGKLEDYPLFSVDHHEGLEDHEVLLHHDQNENNATLFQKLRSVSRILPFNAIICASIWVSAMVWYYHEHCIRSSDGTWISKDIRVPRTVILTWGQAFFPSMFPVPKEDEPCWSMPNDPPAEL